MGGGHFSSFSAKDQVTYLTHMRWEENKKPNLWGGFLAPPPLETPLSFCPGNVSCLANFLLSSKPTLTTESS